MKDIGSLLVRSVLCLSSSFERLSLVANSGYLVTLATTLKLVS